MKIKGLDGTLAKNAEEDPSMSEITRQESQKSNEFAQPVAVILV